MSSTRMKVIAILVVLSLPARPGTLSLLLGLQTAPPRLSSCSKRLGVPFPAKLKARIFCSRHSQPISTVRARWRRRPRGERRGSRSTRRKRPKRTEQSREPARSRSCTCTAACEDVRHSVRTAEVGRRRENLKRQVEFRGRAWGVLTQVKVSSALRRLARGGIVWTAGLDSRPGEWGAEIRRYRTTAKYAGGSSSSAPEVLRLWKPTASSLLAPADNLKIEIAKIQEYGKG